MTEDPTILSSDMITHAKRMISPRTGIIKGIYPAFTQHFDPHTFSFGTEKTDTSRFFYHRAPERGGAAGINKEEAYISSIGEAIERYCCALYNPNDLVFDSYTNLSRGNAVVHPNDIALFSAKQYRKKDFPYKPFDEQSRVSWIMGYSLISNREILLPAQIVFLPFKRRANEIPICPITSTGLAAGPSLEFALRTALFEIIERDAFTIMWLARISPFCINIKDYSEAYNVFQDRFCTNNFGYHFYDITLDIRVPTAMVILKGRIELGPIIGVGCSTRPTMSDAIKKALLEVSQLPPWIRYAFQKEKDWQCQNNFSNIKSFDDHGQLYTRRHDLVKKAFKFLKDKKVINSRNKMYGKGKNCKSGLNFCINEIKERGYDIIYCDLTTRDVLDAGFRVTRVVVPGLVPLHGHHKYPFLGSKRIYSVPVKLGYKKKINESQVNNYPHPSA